jgi:hypothetical protein
MYASPKILTKLLGSCGQANSPLDPAEYYSNRAKLEPIPISQMPQQNQAAGKLKHSEKVFSATPIPHDQAPADSFDRAVTADRFGQH